MAHINAAQSLAATLAAAQRREQAPGHVFVDRLATALAVPTQESSYFDDGDEDLDLPMLVQGNRPGALVPATTGPALRGREGRAALIGFGLGLALLVPIGLVMNNRLSDPTTSASDAVAALTSQNFLPVAAVPPTEDTGIRTTRRPTKVESGIQLSPVTSASAALNSADPEPKATEMVASAVPAGLEEAKAMIATGDIAAARRILQPGAVDGHSPHLLALAETFDPNMLAAWSARGAAPDVERARALYQSALAKGERKARQRLEALD
jgi:hypothetical protein